MSRHGAIPPAGAAAPRRHPSSMGRLRLREPASQFRNTASPSFDGFQLPDAEASERGRAPIPYLPFVAVRSSHACLSICTAAAVGDLHVRSPLPRCPRCQALRSGVISFLPFHASRLSCCSFVPPSPFLSSLPRNAPRQLSSSATGSTSKCGSCSANVNLKIRPVN